LLTIASNGRAASVRLSPHFRTALIVTRTWASARRAPVGVAQRARPRMRIEERPHPS